MVAIGCQTFYDQGFPNRLQITRFPRSTEAQCKGYHAGRRGCTAHDNPYELDTREARAWLRGLNEGRMRQLTVVRSQ
jgi:ribosome modulation factor